ncbi:MAG: CRTAC1 family protein [Chloroflexota bacterium]|nr:CRTAC1 family protein [Chloroflexota bacterium]
MDRQRTRYLLLLVPVVVLILLLSGSLPRRPGVARAPSGSRLAGTARTAPVAVRANRLVASTPCTGRFERHALPHTTTNGNAAIRMFNSNGSGLAIDDLDGDGDEDVVLANLAGPNSILWNEGKLVFRMQKLEHGDSRAVNIVDVNGDGKQDILFSRHTLPPTLWRNLGRGRFVEDTLPGVDGKVYATNWADMDGDGDLDLVAGAYDAGLEKDLGYNFMFTRSGGGLYVYENRGAEFVGQKLSERAEALAVALPDLDGDGQPEIMVGNDFDLPDEVWRRSGEAWNLITPFRKTTHSTMSLDLGDIDNDGVQEVFASDMKPYDQSVRTLAQWRPMMAQMPHKPVRGDRQVMENVLQVRADNGTYRNEAYDRYVDATGWSWSAKFGDLDRDGFLDLYVVNGMIANDLFHYLPHGELVEQNRALRNDGQAHFRHAPEWGLGSTASGRGMSMADMDNDGDIDIIVNNLGGPVVLFENRLCGGSAVLVDLRQNHSPNTRAIGARLVLRTTSGSYHRDVRVASGYLSGDPSRVHFGIPDGATVRRLEVRWPDGAVSIVSSVRVNRLLTVTR